MADIETVKRTHGIVEVLERLGHLPPDRWNGSSEFTISCPIPEHDDHTPSCRIHPHTGRFHCFGCGAHGDVFDLVEHAAGLRTFAEALTWITGREPVTFTVTDKVRPSAGPTFATSPARIMDVNTCAWDFLTADARARIGLRYLEKRGLHVAALPGRTREPVAGYTPSDPRGLSRHLLDRGFSDQEAIEAGWSLAAERGLRDRFRHRVLFPIRDQNGQVLAVNGRDVTNTARAKYLNSPTTPVYRKGDHLYLPVRPGNGTSRLIVCEGPIDVLALMTTRDAAGAVPVGLCGTAMTDAQARLIVSFKLKIVLMADGDAAGQAANNSWKFRLSREGAAAEVVRLGRDDDPAATVISARFPDSRVHRMHL